MAAPHVTIRQKIADLFDALKIPVKTVNVGPMGSVMVTLYGERSAHDAAHALAPLCGPMKICSGFDQGAATEIRNGRRCEVRVWRALGKISVRDGGQA